MTRLTWDNYGEKYFETGLDRGVFYNLDGVGVPWNGLTSVKDTPSGGAPTPYFYDGEQYLNVAAVDKCVGTIEAYTYPDEFADYDGSEQIFTGFSIDMQRRKPFSLSYRTLIGNDVDGADHGYKLHILYNVLTSPSQKTYSSNTNSVNPLIFSWAFTTTPVRANNSHRRTAHVTIDSTKVSVGLLRVIEQHLYGSVSRSPMIMSLDKLIYWFESGGEPLEIDPDFSGGLPNLHSSINDRPRDLITTNTPGLNVKSYDSRLVEIDAYHPPTTF